MKSKNIGRCLLLLAVLMLAVSSCHKNLRPASVLIVDPIRHYYPVLQGEMMTISYEIENTSNNPLFVQEIQTTCGCLVARNQLPLVVLPHKTTSLHLKFNTIKNTGYVDHFIYLYGNFKDTTCVELEFDTNVVPRADYIRDYEQLWHEQATENGNLRDFVDGMPGQKGYYTEPSGVSPRSRTNQGVQGAIDSNSF